MRLPYGKETKQVEGFGFEEHVDGSDHNKYLWGNSAFALAAADEPSLRVVWLVRARFAGWRAAAWWKGCRYTTFTPMRGTWP